MKNQIVRNLQRVLGISFALILVVSLITLSEGASSSSTSQRAEENLGVLSQNKEPNQFVLDGIGHRHKDIHIIYSATSITGKTVFNYQDSKGTYSFTGDEIRTQKTETGTMVTVTLESIPDLRVVTLTLMIPAANLDDSETKLKTIAIRTTNKTTLAGERLVKGQVQSYEVIDLRGTASFVVS